MDLDQLKVELDEYGYVVIPNLIPGDKAERMAKRLIEIMSQQSDTSRLDQNLRGVFNYLDPADDDLFLTLVTNPVFMELAHHKLGDDFQMAEVGCRWLKPGSPGQGLHADVPISWFARQNIPIPATCFMLNCMWMLSEFTRDNGATLLLPFSHNSRAIPRRGVEYRDYVYADGPAGSIVIFDGRIWHAGGANTTKDRHRVGLSSGYFAWWMDPVAGGWYLMKRPVRDRMPDMVQKMNRRVAEE